MRDRRQRPRIWPWGALFDLRARLHACERRAAAFEARCEQLMVENQQLQHDLAWHRVHGWDEPE